MTGNDATTPGLTPERVQFTDETLPWQEAIRRVGRPLVDDGTVEPSYVQAVIDTALSMGPYFDLGRGIAMPHARPEAGAHQVGLSFLRTRTPVLLLDDAKHPIDVFIMLAAPDSTSHLGVLRELAGVLTDPERVTALKEAADADAVVALLSGN